MWCARHKGLCCTIKECKQGTAPLTSGVLVVIIVQKHGMNVICLTQFKKINLNTVKHASKGCRRAHRACVQERDCSKTATSSQQVVYLWQLSFKNPG